MEPLITYLMNLCITLLVLVLSSLPIGVASADEQSLSVIPAPLFIQHHESGIDLEKGGKISIPAGLLIQENVAWVSSLIKQHSGITLSLTTTPISNAIVQLQLVSPEELGKQFEQAGLPLPTRIKEAYTLKTGPTHVTVQATAPTGLFYAMTSLWQLLTSELDCVGKLPGLNILDAPEFAWRGLMLDSARHMQSVEFIKRYIDWMSLHKMNVFHWHLTDDQAWRLEIKAYPKLAETGGYRVPAGAAPAADIDPLTGQPRLYGGYYTQEDVREIVAHAARRHVTVVPEIDVPGHASAAIAAYPELGVSGHGVDHVPASWGIYNNVFNLEETTFEFLEAVLTEVVEMFPGRFIHLGGDEVQTAQWQGSQRVQQRMNELGIKNLQSLQNYYVERLQRFLDQFERRIIGWDEILESDLPQNAAVMSWRGVDGAIKAAEKGHQTVLSPAPTLYLDHLQTTAADAPPGRGGVITLRDIYEFDPLPDTIGENTGYVLGLQGNLWTEHVRTEERVAYMTYPRASAIAELAWSSPGQRNWDAFALKLPIHVTRLEQLGIDVAKDDYALYRKAEASLVDLPDTEAIKREDRELELCTNAIVLALEDDAPIAGARESFLVDIQNPCWIWRDVDLTSVQSVSAAVGQVPFNFEIGNAIDNVTVDQAQTSHGALKVSLGQCDGPLLAKLSLQPAVENQAVTTLSAALLQSEHKLPVRGDLCFSFTRHGVDPIWVIDWVQLERVVR